MPLAAHSTTVVDRSAALLPPPTASRKGARAHPVQSDRLTADEIRTERGLTLAKPPLSGASAPDAAFIPDPTLAKPLHPGASAPDADLPSSSLP